MGRAFWYCWTTGCNFSYGFSSRRIVDDCVGGLNVNFMHVMFCGQSILYLGRCEGIGQINYYILNENKVVEKHFFRFEQIVGILCTLENIKLCLEYCESHLSLPQP